MTPWTVSPRASSSSPSRSRSRRASATSRSRWASGPPTRGDSSSRAIRAPRGARLCEWNGDRQQLVDVLLRERRDQDRARLGLRLELFLDPAREDALAVERLQDRRRHERRDERHQHERREQRVRDHAGLEREVEHDQLGEPARVHQRAEHGAGAPVVARERVRRGGAPRACRRSRSGSAAAVIAHSSGRSSRPTSVRKPGVDEEQRQQQGDDEVLEPPRQAHAQLGVPGHGHPTRTRRRSRAMPICSVT